MPRKAKSKIINRAHKWKQWYIKEDSNWWVRWFMMLSSWKSAYHLFIILFICFLLLFIYSKDNQTLEYHFYISTNNALTQIYPKNIQVTLSELNRPPPKHLSRLVNKNTLLNLNIAFFYILASPDVLTWFTTNGHHLNTIEITLHMVNRCKEM